MFCRSFLFFQLPLLVMVVTFAVFTLVQHGELSSSKVFSAISVFAIFSNSLTSFFQVRLFFALLFFPPLGYNLNARFLFEISLDLSIHREQRCPAEDEQVPSRD